MKWILLGIYMGTLNAHHTYNRPQLIGLFEDKYVRVNDVEDIIRDVYIKQKIVGMDEKSTPKMGFCEVEYKKTYVTISENCEELIRELNELL